MLLALSVELLEVIGAQLAPTDHVVLRQVCRDLNGAICRLFFSALTLKMNQTGSGLSEDTVEKLKVLGTGQTGWSFHAKTLRIFSDRMANKEDAHNDKLVDLLDRTLASLSKIQTVVWHVHHRDLPWGHHEVFGWGQTAILHFLNTLPNLNNLELNIPNTLNVSELKVQTLRRFTLKTPGHGRGPSWRPLNPEAYEDFVHLIISQKQLSSLHIEGFVELSAVWRMLRSKPPNTVKVTEITTTVVTQELFDYLSSFSGIRKLTLRAPDGGNVDESNRLADTFFETVLPHHVESLEELSCPAAFESRFSFGRHNVDLVSSLHKLTKLEMSINAGAVRRIKSVASIGVSVKAKQADITPVVKLLLETAATLPALSSLTIVPAETERNRGMWCGNGRIHHKGAVATSIATAVMTFRTDEPSAAIVRAGFNTYELGLRGSVRKGRLGYKETGSWSRY
ncbi:hypothetical protein C8R45DRAFT_1213163 [Mycena sanguinolenta]|nr:hypothetical protein C8R45DRAFT_1213163 [Mycena sanguinolenta]